MNVHKLYNIHKCTVHIHSVCIVKKSQLNTYVNDDFRFLSQVLINKQFLTLSLYPQALQQFLQRGREEIKVTERLEFECHQLISNGRDRAKRDEQHYWFIIKDTRNITTVQE